MLKRKSYNIYIIGIAVVLFSYVLLWWIIDDHYPGDVSLRIPGMDNRPKIDTRPDTLIIGEYFDTLSLI